MILFIKDVLPQGSSGHFARLALETGECLFAAEHNAPVAVHTQRRQGGIAFGTNVGRVHSREDWLPVQKRAANKYCYSLTRSPYCLDIRGLDLVSGEATHHSDPSAHKNKRGAVERPEKVTGKT